jgi:hypothetical protein
MTENLLLRKTRLLTQVLILSGTLNIGLLATFVYVAAQGKQEALSIELKPKQHSLGAAEGISNAAILKSYSLLPYQELLLRLENKEPVEEGLCKRDIALTCLVAFHHFNLEKALSGVTLQKRRFFFTNDEGQEKIDVPVFPGLLDEQFQALLHYAKTEKWPLTSQGLFFALQRAPLPRDPFLIDAFCLTPEYETIATLFSKTGLQMSPSSLLDLLCEGDWKILADFIQAQRRALDLSVDCRRSLLLSYLDQRSKSAAKLLLETDMESLLKRGNDSQILTLFELSEATSPHLAQFAKSLLASPRTDAIWKRVATLLYAQAQEILPDPYDHRLVMQRFFPPSKEETPLPAFIPIKAQKKIYIVEKGDNLWKISQKFRVSIEEIKKANHLETEKLRPGKQLEIPIKGCSKRNTSQN